MRRYLLRLGDKSTVGGTVIEGIERCTHRGKPITFIGARVFCPACNSDGVIASKGPHRSATMMGKQQALEGDICMCKCGTPPVMIASQDTAWHEFASHEQAGMVHDSRDQSMTGENRTAYDQRFHIVNPRTGQPLRDKPYRVISDDGTTVEGHTDANGYTERITSDQAISATLSVLKNDTPINPDWDKYL